MRRSAYDQVLIDLNTQCDFLLPRGALPVANRALVLPNIRRLMSWARTTKTPVLSTLECHRPGECHRWLPPCCIDRTTGQRKVPFTLLPRRILLHGDNTSDVPLDPFRRCQQIIITKRDRDFLSNPKADRLINVVSSGQLVVFGILAEQCVKLAVLGLLARRHRVAVVIDACGHLASSDAQLAFLQMEAKGAQLVTTEDVITGKVRAALQASRLNEEDDDKSDLLLRRSNGNGRGPNGNGTRHGGSRRVHEADPATLSRRQRSSKLGSSSPNPRPKS